MTPNQLNAEELQSLRELTHGSLRARISDAHAAKLINLAYARESPEGLTITTLGRAVLATSLPDWPAGQKSTHAPASGAHPGHGSPK